MTWSIIESDALTALRAMPEASFDSVVTDPPAGIKFMGADWDGDKGGRDQWIAWLAEIFVELRRVVKPGAHAIVWALPKTSHWTATAMENAGWEIRDVATHLFGQGMPKSVDVSKAIDKAAGAKRPIIGYRVLTGNAALTTKEKGGTYGVGVGSAPSKTIPVTAPATEDAKKWDGWGTGLKPASEHWILARAPFDKKTIVGNVLAHGTGAINVDACRIGRAPDDRTEYGLDSGIDHPKVSPSLGTFGTVTPYVPHVAGRWPANLTLQHSDGCVLVGTKKVRTGTAHRSNGGGLNFGNGSEKPPLEDMGYADADGFEEVEDWACEPECAVRLLDEQAGECPGMSGGGVHREEYGGGLFGGIDSASTARGDSGGPARFFYTAKPAKSEKEKGLEWMPSRTVNDGRKSGGVGNNNPRLRGESKRKNFHTTVKPVDLMRYLCKLVTPPGGTVLDCFAGSGTTVVAALADGFSCVGIEQDPAYVELAKARVEGDAPLLNRQPT